VGSDIGRWSPGISTGDPEAVALLTRALALRGIATGVAGTTAVLSGMEHLVSHMLDQHHSAHHLPMGLHGAQVGAASVVAAAAWEMLFDRFGVEPARLDESAFDPARARARVESVFRQVDPTGRVAAECWQDYSTKLATVTRLRDRLEGVVEAWSSHEPELRALVRPSADIAASLHAAGAVVSFADLDPQVDASLVRWAVTNCALMRNRFTVVDLLTLLGWWTELDVDELLERSRIAGSDGRARSN
jgi:glycerol-1-phosphate dehydrogenase [NAD(P)+]